ncbi:MAG TPA: hypothetical protein VF534_33955 [Paraburkholderia sp.]
MLQRVEKGCCFASSVVGGRRDSFPRGDFILQFRQPIPDHLYGVFSKQQMNPRIVVFDEIEDNLRGLCRPDLLHRRGNRRFDGPKVCHIEHNPVSAPLAVRSNSSFAC